MVSKAWRRDRLKIASLISKLTLALLLASALWLMVGCGAGAGGGCARQARDYGRYVN